MSDHTTLYSNGHFGALSAEDREAARQAAAAIIPEIEQPRTRREKVDQILDEYDDVIGQLAELGHQRAREQRALDDARSTYGSFVPASIAAHQEALAHLDVNIEVRRERVRLLHLAGRNWLQVDEPLNGGDA